MISYFKVIISQIMKYGSERPVVVSVQLRELKRASFDKKLFTVKDQLTNVISIGDVVRVLDGSLKVRPFLFFWMIVVVSESSCARATYLIHQ